MRLQIPVLIYPIHLWFKGENISTVEIEELRSWHTDCLDVCEFTPKQITKICKEISFNRFTLEDFEDNLTFVTWVRYKFSKAGYTDLYRYYDKDNKLLYVGISVSAITRQGQHKDSAVWYPEFTHMTKETFRTRKEALLAEKLAIKQEHPIYNITHKDFNKPTEESP